MASSDKSLSNSILEKIVKDWPKLDLQSQEKLSHSLTQSIARMIYGSNMIEFAGSSLDITISMCQDVFLSKSADPAGIHDYNPNRFSFSQLVEHLKANNRPTDLAEVEKSIREVVQHIQALVHVLIHIVVNDRAWTEKLLSETHQILYKGLDKEVEAGKYRTFEIAIRYGKTENQPKVKPCLRASAVRGYMKEFIAHLKKDTKTEMDPFERAACCHHQFINIYPFGNGNGRMSRILVTVLLLKHAGAVCEIGLTQEERDKYVAICIRGARKFYEEDMEVDYDERMGHLRLARFIKEKSKSWKDWKMKEE
jgi:Uncharacterized conserved protein